MKSGFGIVAAIALALGSGAAPAQDYPTGPVKILVQFPPGGVPDLVGRTLAEKFSQAFGKPFVVENRTGANGNIATEAVVKSEPDGRTLLLAASGSIAMGPNIYTKLPFDPQKDLAPITLATTYDFVMLAAPGFAANTPQELVALAKARPGKLSFASSGFGSEHHLSGELFNLITGAGLVHVPYKGFGPATVDVMGGQIEIMFGSIPAALPFIKSGKLKALAVTGTERSPQLPNVPTFVESGVKGLVVQSWVGLLAPAGTPQAIIDKLNAAAVRGLQQPEVVQRFAAMSMAVAAQGPKEFAAQLDSDTKSWAKIVKDTGIKRIE
ncbi:MAG: tripartite tricarboxylate transporter substrate binding protein [Burkholderiales bacterium]